jgi:putative two-component system response regulator
MLEHVLGGLDGVEVTTYLEPRVALAAAHMLQYDLMVVDHVMPDLSGIELSWHLRQIPGYRAVPIIMVTSDNDRMLRVEAFNAGVTDFINKPFDRIELVARVRNLLALRRAQRDLADRAEWLAREVEAATQHLAKREEEVIWRLARAVEFRDSDTGEHVSRVANISRMMAVKVGLEAEQCRNIYLAAALHDVGKIGVRDAVLSKPGKLDSDEMEEMRRHVEFGGRILAEGDTDLIRMAERIALSHHERWDGTGYPHKLAGASIPIEGRIVAVADVFDALCSDRPYKRAWPIAQARAEINTLAGSHFDPACVAAFEACWPQIAPLMQTLEPQAAARSA